MGKLITGLFRDPTEAAAAVETLISEGADPRSISVVAAESSASEVFAVKAGSNVSEGAAIGAGVRGGIGAVIAGLTTVGVSSATGVGVVASGPVVAALVGAGAGRSPGGPGGGVIGGLIGLGIPEHEISRIEQAIEDGGVLVGVNAAVVDAEQAGDVFAQYHAEQISAT